VLAQLVLALAVHEPRLFSIDVIISKFRSTSAREFTGNVNTTFLDILSFVV
jgi:hypothetical protein